MYARTFTAAAVLATVGLLLVGCDPASTSSSKPSTGISASTDTSTGPAGLPAPTTTKAAESKAVPNFVGMGLQAAQDTAQSAGFFLLTSHDSLGRDRSQILDRDWQVCSQTPKAGTTAPVTAKVDMGAVKLDEKCPATDQKPPAKVGTTMPNLVGKGLAAARDALPSGASITTKDASSDDRFILVESNWKICTQNPKAGAEFRGQPVTFTAVKTDESCP